MRRDHGPVPDLHDRVQAAARRGAPERRDQPERAGATARPLARAAAHLGGEVRARRVREAVGQVTPARPYEAKIAGLERKVGQLTMELDLLKKGLASATPAERREPLRRQRPGACTIRAGCRVMSLAPSSYYYRPKASRPRRSRRSRAGRAHPRDLRRVPALRLPPGHRAAEGRGAAGQPQAGRADHARAGPAGTTASGASSSRPTATTTARSSRTWPRTWCPTGPDQLWVADLTYIRILTGFVYLAVILDAWSRRVVGWALGRRDRCRSGARGAQGGDRQPRPPPGCVHHSDRGSQYASEPYRETLRTRARRARWGGAATRTTTPRRRAS